MTKIFIIHGWTYTTFKWDNFVEQIKNAGMDPILLSVPGLTEPSDKALTLDDYVEWLKVKLEGENDPIVIGHSNGGRIALAFALKYPDRLKQLVLVDSAGIYHNEWPIRVKRFIFKGLAILGKLITSSETMRKLLYRVAGEADYKNASLHMRKTMANLISVDLASRIHEIQVPTLIIWGKKDRETPMSDGQKMHSLIKQSTLFVIPEAGHSPYFSHPTEVVNRILEEIKA